MFNKLSLHQRLYFEHFVRSSVVPYYYYQKQSEISLNWQQYCLYNGGKLPFYNYVHKHLIKISCLINNHTIKGYFNDNGGYECFYLALINAGS